MLANGRWDLIGRLKGWGADDNNNWNVALIHLDFNKCD